MKRSIRPLWLQPSQSVCIPSYKLLMGVYGCGTIISHALCPFPNPAWVLAMGFLDEQQHDNSLALLSPATQHPHPYYGFHRAMEVHGGSIREQREAMGAYAPAPAAL